MPGDFSPFDDQSPAKGSQGQEERRRHRELVEGSIKGDIADIIAEEAIIGKDSKNRTVKVPIRGIKEYHFIHGGPQNGVGQESSGQPAKGTVIAQDQTSSGQSGQAGNAPGEDYYITEVPLDEILDLMFEDLSLPNLQIKQLKELKSQTQHKTLGTTRVGIRVRLKKKETVRAKLRRQVASVGPVRSLSGVIVRPTSDEIEQVHAEDGRFPFHEKDLRYRRIREDIEKISQAAVFCVMDTSGSMDEHKKYLAKAFFYLLVNFVRVKYEQVEVVFVAHHTEAKEVGEQEFFHKGESGGTYISSGPLKVSEIIEQRYPPALWNLYFFHFSDGENWSEDNKRAIAAFSRLTLICNLVGVGEVLSRSNYWSDQQIKQILDQSIKATNFQTVRVTSKEEVWPKFVEFFSHDKRVV